MTGRFHLARSVREIDRAAWGNCFAGEPENYDFYRACELAGPPGFEWFYAVMYDETGPVAIVPAFGTRYRVDTTLQGPLRSVADRVHRVAPWLLEVPLFALGSPVAEVCHVGTADRVGSAGRRRLLAELVRRARACASDRGYGLFGVKDAAEADRGLWTSAMEEGGFACLPGLPTASLDLPYTSLDAYLASLGKGTRKDMRRKLKAFSGVRIERRSGIADVADEVHALYRQTVEGSEMRFEQLPRDFFPVLMDRLAPNARMILYFHEEKLFGFNLVIESEDRLIDKYVGMDYAVARRLNFYFNSWMVNVAWCIDNRVPVYQSGQSSYGPKLRLGCRLSPNAQYFRHRNPLANLALRQVARLVRLDRTDPAIASLVAQTAR